MKLHRHTVLEREVGRELCQCVCGANHPHRTRICTHVPDDDGVCRTCREAAK